jgi:hypothetical protein
VDAKKRQYVHIYGQGSWSDNAIIVGNSLGLKALRDALTETLIVGVSGIEAYTNKEHYYFVCTVRLNDPKFFNLNTPYYKEETQEPEAVDPKDLNETMLALGVAERQLVSSTIREKAREKDIYGRDQFYGWYQNFGHRFGPATMSAHDVIYAMWSAWCAARMAVEERVLDGDRIPPLEEEEKRDTPDVQEAPEVEAKT